MNKREKNIPKIIFVIIILCSTIFGISFSLINNDPITTSENYNNEKLTQEEKDRIKISLPNSQQPEIKTPIPPKKQTIKGLLQLGEFNGINKKKKAKEIPNENKKQ